MQITSTPDGDSLNYPHGNFKVEKRTTIVEHLPCSVPTEKKQSECTGAMGPKVSCERLRFIYERLALHCLSLPPPESLVQSYTAVTINI